MTAWPGWFGGPLTRRLWVRTKLKRKGFHSNVIDFDGRRVMLCLCKSPKIRVFSSG